MNSIDTASLPEGHDELISTPPIPPIGREAECQLINREISWLAFNERVLAEAENTAIPCLSGSVLLRFRPITSMNS